MWNYTKECLQILYWTFFKPYTFRRYLRDIYPTLDIETNPFKERAHFANNPRLKRYADQVAWINLLIPFVITVLVAIPYSIYSEEPFLWSKSVLFLCGWSLGVLIATNFNENLQVKLLYTIIIILGIQVLWILGILPKTITLLPNGEIWVIQIAEFFRNLMENIKVIYLLAFGVAFGMAGGVAGGVALGVAGGMVGGVAFGVAGGVAGGVAFGVAFGVVGGVAIGVAVGVAVGVALGVAGGVALGVALGVAGGVALGVAGGVAFGVTFIAGVLRLYFWLPELLLTVFLYFFHTDPAKALRFLPTRWDELIILPLPFMDRLIIEAYQTNPTIAKQTIDHLTHSTNQQPVAAKAMVGIAIHALNHCKTPQDIRALELRWLPSPPPKGVGLLPKLLDISQDVDAALQKDSAYLKQQALKNCLSQLKNLSQQIRLSRDSYQATQFGPIIQQWQHILETAHQGLQQQARRSQEIMNPYIAGVPLDPALAGERFQGRRDLIQQIESLTLAVQPPILLLYGGRRTGKTSLLKYLPYKVESTFLPIFIDVQGLDITNFTFFAKDFSTEFIDNARKIHNLTLPPPNTEILAEAPFYALKDWFKVIEKIVQDKRILLCLDEFECLSKLIANTNDQAPLDFLRHIMQHRQQWVLLFSGANLLTELPSYWSNYLINTQTVRVSYLDEPYARQLITQPVTDFPAKVYTPAAVDTIIHWTRCQPYLIQLLCLILIKRINQAKRKIVEVADVETAIPEAIKTGEQYFTELWHDTANQHEALSQILANQPVQDQAALKRLIYKEIIDQETLQFQVPMVKYAFEHRDPI
ncbi:conserved hypothetical protein, membrane [Beggiatoa sp. PS]|nr:conserved hypothetical protein, membrane [Beggiatoa sp. PS]